MVYMDFSSCSDFNLFFFLRSESLKQVIESRRPETRTVVECKIIEVQKKLEEALRLKAYADAAPLQDELERLLQKRNELPTIDELNYAVQKAEAAVSEAAENRDFSSAAALQAKVEDARARLAEAITTEDPSDSDSEMGAEKAKGKDVDSKDGYKSRAELERAISGLKGEIKKAIDGKQFKKASYLQSTLDEKEKLRLLFPSVDELRTELNNAKDGLDRAVKSNDFAAAGELQEKVTALEEKLLQEKENVDTSVESDHSCASVVMLDGNAKMFESRSQIETHVLLLNTELAEFIANKDFKKAEACQSVLDNLQELRQRFPSIAELQKSVKQKKKEIETAISEKRFADADRLNQSIVELEAKIEEDIAREPNQSPKAVAPTVAPRNTAKIPLASTNKFCSSGSVRSEPIAHNSPTKTQTHAATVVGGRFDRSSVAKPPSAINPYAPDDVSDVTSVHSHSSKRPVIKTQSTNKESDKKLRPLHEDSMERPVSKLRPKRPLISYMDDSILSVAQFLSAKRGDASLVVDESGGLVGIVTDVDLTRRLIGKNIDPSSTEIARIMTRDPTCVSMCDSATDAMTTMLENHFRHLPVVDANGAVVGLLDIARCLNDALSKIEKSNSKGRAAAEEALKQVAGGAHGAQAAALQALLAPLMAAFGNQSSPTLRSLLDGKQSTIVSQSTSVLEAGMLMAERRHSCLVLDDNDDLVGIVSFKDIMTRVVAKELPPETTLVSAVLTPNPEAVSPEITVLEALQFMHDNHFKSLPVCEQDGTVIGLVDVLDCMLACGVGAEGWRSVFNSALDLDDLSESGSAHSGHRSAAGSAGPSVRSAKGRPSATETSSRCVQKLRPAKPLISYTDDSILSVAKMMASKRGDCALIVDSKGGLAGILTDTDIGRRVVARHVDPSSAEVSEVMTPNPSFTSMDDNAMDAMSIMVENHFRHLPVVDKNGAVVGLLDIARLLNDVISKLERSNSKSGAAAEEALKQVVSQQGVQGSQVAALQALLGPLMEAFGNQSSPTLRSLLEGKPSTVVRPTASVLEAAMLMSESRKAALIANDNGELVGIFGFKDLMTRVIAKELPPEQTEIAGVMTPSPETVSPDITVLEALQTMVSLVHMLWQ